MERTRLNDYSYSPSHVVCLSGPLIVGAGPSGLAAAACLKRKGIDSLIIERENCIASLWKLKTYDRLRLHLPKQFCELPLFHFPSSYPKYPTKHQFIDYLSSYADHFGIKPVFNNTVLSAEFDYKGGFWKVRTVGVKMEEITYYCQWLVVASGENAQEKVPDFEGMEEFGGLIIHTSSYKNGESLSGKGVLVVGCGNSGMEICLDLCNFNAYPSLVVRDPVHILPQEMLGRSTFGVSMLLLKWLPLWMVDQFLLLSSRLSLGDTTRFGLNHPKYGPLHLKNLSGKTPVLDVGTFAQIKNGNIKVYPGIKRLKRLSVEFVDGRVESFDAIVLATGYRSNVTSWLKSSKTLKEKDGFPRELFADGWKGESGLYAVGFSKRGILGASMDAMRIAEEIEKSFKSSQSNNEFSSKHSRI